MDPYGPARSKRGEALGHLRHQFHEMDERLGARTEYDDGDVVAPKILLVRKPVVLGEERVELARSHLQQFTVFQALPPTVLNRFDFMLPRHKMPQSDGKILVK